jgi:MtN3 and saliva related transmembrane protein
MDIVTSLGLLAGTLTTIAFFPQLIKVWKSKSAHDLSMVWLVTFISGVSLWLIYGVLVNGLPIILANSVTLALTLVILGFKLKFG